MIKTHFMEHSRLPGGCRAACPMMPWHKQLVDLRYLVACLVLGVLLGACEDRATREEKARCKNQTMAYIMSKEPIRQRMKLDLSAHFPTRPEITVKPLGDCRHEIRGFVLSRDDLGGLAQNHYIAVMRYRGNNYWELESFQRP